MAGPPKDLPFGGSIAKFKHDGLVGESSSICVFSKTGKYLASCQSALDVKIFSTEKNIVTSTLEGHVKPVVMCAFSPKDTFIATCSRDTDLRLYDPVTGEQTAHLRGHQQGVSCAVFSSDGNTLASCCDGGVIKLWDVTSKKEKLSIQAHESYAYMLAFSPDGTKLASCGWDNLVKLFDAATGELLQTFTGHTGGVRTLSFSPDGRVIASSSVDAHVGLWDVENGGAFSLLEGHKDEVTGCCFSPDGRMLLSCSKDKTVKLWDVNKPHKKKKRGGVFKLLSTIEHPTAVTSCSFSPDGSRIMTTDRCIRLYRLRILSSLVQIEGHKYGINGAIFAPDGLSIASWAGDYHVRLFNVSPECFTEDPDLALVGLMFDTDSLEKAYMNMNPFSLIPLENRPFEKHVATMFHVFQRFLDVNGWDSSSERDFEAGVAILDRYVEGLLIRAGKESTALQGIFTKLRKAQRTMYRNVMCGIRSEPHYVPFIECASLLENLLAQQPSEHTLAQDIEKFGAAQMLTLYRNGLEAKSTHQQFLSLVCTKAGAKMGEVGVKNMARTWQEARFAEGMKAGDGDGGRIAAQSALEIISGTVEFDSTSKMLTFLELMTAADPSLAEHSLQRGWSADTAGINTKIRIVSVRDGFGRDDPDPSDESTFATPDSPFSDGWCECVVSFYFLFDDTKHVCSVRLLHQSLVETKKNMGNAAQIEAQMNTARALLQGSGNAFMVGEAREDQELEEEVMAAMLEEARHAQVGPHGLANKSLARRPSGLKKKQSFWVSNNNSGDGGVQVNHEGTNLEEEEEEEEESQGGGGGGKPQMLGAGRRGVSSAALFRRGVGATSSGGPVRAPAVLNHSQSSRRMLKSKNSFTAIGEAEEAGGEGEDVDEALTRMRSEFDENLHRELSTLGTQAKEDMEKKLRAELIPVLRQELRAEVEAEFTLKVRREFELKIRDEVTAKVRADMEGSKRKAIEEKLRKEAEAVVQSEMAQKRQAMMAELEKQGATNQPLPAGVELTAPVNPHHLSTNYHNSLSPEAPKIPMARLGSRSASGRFDREPSELEEGMVRHGSNSSAPFIAMGGLTDTPKSSTSSSRLRSLKNAIKKVVL